MNRASQILLTIVMGFIGCHEDKTTATLPLSISVKQVPDTVVHKSALVYDMQLSLWTLDSLPYSGYAVILFPDGKSKEKFGVLDGKRQNEAVHWYADGHLKHLSNYLDGKLHGDKKTWSPDSSHILLSHLQYTLGKLHGEQKKWYPSGELFKWLNFNMGKEEGLQRAYRKNGVLYANYEARNGRVFGLKKAGLCYSLDNGKTQFRKE